MRGKPGKCPKLTPPLGGSTLVGMTEPTATSLHAARNGGSRPVPDPTEKTTESMIAAISALREVLLERINGDKATFETRLSGMDQAIKLVREMTDKIPALMDEKVAHSTEVSDVKFGGIEKQFVERDVRTAQTTLGTKTAVDAALLAQQASADKSAEAAETAAAKTEAAFTKQIDGLGIILDKSIDALDGKITDLKDRFNRGEGRGEGQVVAKQQSQASGGYVIAAVGLVTGMLIGVAGIILALARP